MSRETVLALLRRGEGAFLSGEELSRRLGLSCAAVWKAVEALRREGYGIEARTGLGYRLATVPDAMTEAEIRSFLGETAVVGRELR
ncbi:biotin operon repressor, partial [uncultured Oscillibacter sp.]|uniref:biotin operon repressor n=1 Tax=uncultured Oscillibacter sp. TaxID=876091 RepID=UPI00263938AA